MLSVCQSVRLPNQTDNSENERMGWIVKTNQRSSCCLAVRQFGRPFALTRGVFLGDKREECGDDGRSWRRVRCWEWAAGGGRYIYHEGGTTHRPFTSCKKLVCLMCFQQRNCALSTARRGWRTQDKSCRGGMMQRRCCLETSRACP